jgi:NADH dehydrogenase (ubiquinone) 1 alpha subcomplex subunit 9
VECSDAVINLLGIGHNTPHFLMEEVNVDGCRNIAKACKEMNVPRLVHFSTIHADEKSRYRFFRSKGLGEKAVREEYPEATIIRPTSMFGLYDDYLDSFRSKLRFHILDVDLNNWPFFYPSFNAMQEIQWVCGSR